MDFVFSKAAKMELTSYDSKRRKLESRKVSVNPESYARSFSTRNEKVASRVQMADGNWLVKKTVDFVEALNFDLWFDNTGAIPDSTDLEQDLKWLEKNLVKFDGNLHATRYIGVAWGGLDLFGQLKSLSISYLYFSQDGRPLRAKATLGFEQVSELSQMNREKKSPDLTHMRVVQAGETLPMMCYHIYNDAKYYVQVAKANGLPNITNLEPGQKIYFPPLPFE